MRFKFIEDHRTTFSINLMCQVMAVSPRGLRAHRSRPARRRQRSDLVTLAHIKEQSRLSLGNYGRPRMTEDLKEVGLNAGHRCVGRLMRQNGISVVRTLKYKAATIARQAIAAQSAERGTAITSSISRQTCWIVTSTLMRPTKSGQAISVISGRARGGCTWLGGLEPDETRPCDQGFEDGHRIPSAAQGLHPSHGSWVAILFARLPEDPAPARVQGVPSHACKHALPGSGCLGRAIAMIMPPSRPSSKPSKPR